MCTYLIPEFFPYLPVILVTVLKANLVIGMILAAGTIGIYLLGSRTDEMNAVSMNMADEALATHYDNTDKVLFLWFVCFILLGVLAFLISMRRMELITSVVFEAWE